MLHMYISTITRCQWRDDMIALYGLLTPYAAQSPDREDTRRPYRKRLYLRILCHIFPDSKIHGANIGPTWVLSAPGGPHVDHMNRAIWVYKWLTQWASM